MARKQAKRRKPQSQRVVTLPSVGLARIAGVVLAAAFLVGVYRLSTLALDRPILAIDLEAPLKRVTAAQIQSAVQPELSAGFISANLRAMRERIEALEWVDVAIVRRRWPDRLQILVVEQIPAARWQGDGLLNTRGELFVTGARHIPTELPRLSGPEDTVTLVASRYLAMNGRLIEAGLGLAAVELDERGAWRLVLTNGVEVRLGRRDVDVRAERFLDVVTGLVAQREGEIAFVDMRYSNGFSIGWKHEKFQPRSVEDPEGRPVMTAERGIG